MPAAHRKKIAASVSKAMRQRFLMELEEDIPKPTQKPCSKCKKMKSLEDFYTRKVKLKSGVMAVYPEPRCKPCCAVQKKAYYDRLKAEGRYKAYREQSAGGRDQENKRRYNREWATARRREKGVPIRGPYKTGREDLVRGHSKRVPAGPLTDYLRKEVEARGAAEVTLQAAVGWSRPTAVRRLYSLLEGEQDSISIATADHFLTGLGHPELLQHLYPLDEKLSSYTYVKP